MDGRSAIMSLGYLMVLSTCISNVLFFFVTFIAFLSFFLSLNELYLLLILYVFSKMGITL